MDIRFGNDMEYPLENSVAEIHTDNSIVFVIRGDLGELDFHTDSVAGIPTVWNGVISSFEELEAIYNFMKDHKNLWFDPPKPELEEVEETHLDNKVAKKIFFLTGLHIVNSV